MPFSAKDIDKHNKGLTGAARRVWLRIANERLAACSKSGLSAAECDASAIKQANAAAKQVTESLRIGATNAVMIFPEASSDGEALPTVIQETLYRAPDSIMRLLDSIRSAVYKAFGERSWVRDVTKDRVIYSQDGDEDLRMVSWSEGEDGEISLGSNPVTVRIVYEPVTSESAAAIESGNGAPVLDITGPVIQIREAEAGADGNMDVQIIEPGEGSSAIYPANVIERDGPRIFKAGTHMYWDHPTPTEHKERPERSVQHLGAVLTEDARWEPRAGKDGKGALMAKAKAFSGDFKRLKEMAPHIGVSIHANGTAEPGWKPGQGKPTVSALTKGLSVDFVTVPGAGGRIMQLFESARNGSPPPDSTSLEETTATMTDQEQNEMQGLRDKVKALETQVTESQQTAARSREALLMSETRTYVSELLSGEGYKTLPKPTAKRLQESLCADPPTIAEGERKGLLDRDVLKKRVEEAVRAELEYLASVTGRKVPGSDRGGVDARESSGGSPYAGSAGSGAESIQRLAKTFQESWGMSEEAALAAAKGR